ncbi:MAG: Fur family transcriptional regulator [Egibacteraceae bacterium]
MSVDTVLADALRRHGHRLTRPRVAVWDVVRSARAHVTAEEIAERVQRHSPGVNLASVYRSLAVLAELDLVRESRLSDDGAATWELAHPDEHFHMVCKECGKVTHHEGTLVEQVRSHLENGHGFQPETIELVVTGRCADCAAAASSSG